METINFLPDFINKINTIREDEFKKFNFQYEDIILEKKVLNENTMEFKSYKNKTIKKALMEKLKPGNIGKKEYSTTDNTIDILEDDIFNNTSENTDDDVKLDLDLLDIPKKTFMINDFLQRKNIILDEDNMKKVDDIINNPEINLKKYLNISKIYQQITKISFIKKLENCSYIIDLNDNKPKKSKKYFLK